MKRVLAAVALLSSGMAGCAMQSTGLYDGATTFTIENDTFTGSDNNYTNGLGVTWVSNALDTYDEESFVRRWGDFWSFLPFVSDDGYDTYAAWSIAQEMHTPDDITNPNPLPDDQPTSGFCTSTTCSMREANVGCIPGASDSEWLVPIRTPTTCRGNFTR